MTKTEAMIYLSDRVQPGEEVFILKARDLLAVPTVFYWAQLAEKHGVSIGKVGNAWKCAERMVGFSGRRLPD